MSRGSGGGFGVVGQVMDLDRWISVSWIRWWRGFGSVEIGAFGSWRLVGFLVEISGFRLVGFLVGFWVWIGAVCGASSVAPMVGFWLGLN